MKQKQIDKLARALSKDRNMQILKKREMLANRRVELTVEKIEILGKIAKVRIDLYGNLNRELINENKKELIEHFSEIICNN